MATKGTFCGSNQTADSSWKYICRAYAATLSVALVMIVFGLTQRGCETERHTRKLLCQWDAVWSSDHGDNFIPKCKASQKIIRIKPKS